MPSINILPAILSEIFYSNWLIYCSSYARK